MLAVALVPESKLEEEGVVNAGPLWEVVGVEKRPPESLRERVCCFSPGPWEEIGAGFVEGLAAGLDG